MQREGPYLKCSTGLDGIEVKVGDTVWPKVPRQDACSFLCRSLLGVGGLAQSGAQTHGIHSGAGVVPNPRVHAFLK